MKIRELLIVMSTLIMTSLLSGCILTDEFKASLVEEHNREKEKPLNEQTQAYRIQQLENSIEEINQFKPQLVRVIQLEQDLAYITGALKQDRSTLAVNSSTEKFLLSNSLNDVIEQNAQSLARSRENGNDIPPELQNLSILEDSKKTNPPSIENQSVEVRSATPPLRLSSSNEGSNEVVDAKFSSLNSADITLANEASNASALQKRLVKGSQDKFSGKHDKSVNPCSRDFADYGELSIHLASYSSLSNAKTGWKRLSEKHKNSICGLRAVLADVNVSGKNYLSLRVGPLRSVEDVSLLCSEIRAAGDYCAAAKYIGKPL